jgi:hypothetical protein
MHHLLSPCEHLNHFCDCLLPESDPIMFKFMHYIHWSDLRLPLLSENINLMIKVSFGYLVTFPSSLALLSTVLWHVMLSVYSPETVCARLCVSFTRRINQQIHEKQGEKFPMNPSLFSRLSSKHRREKRESWNVSENFHVFGAAHTKKRSQWYMLKGPMCMCGITIAIKEESLKKRRNIKQKLCV